eukprot:scaffold41143_cov65-Phaeocystis_antarctica.AAC.4
MLSSVSNRSSSRSQWPHAARSRTRSRRRASRSSSSLGSLRCGAWLSARKKRNGCAWSSAAPEGTILHTSSRTACGTFSPASVKETRERSSQRSAVDPYSGSRARSSLKDFLRISSFVCSLAVTRDSNSRSCTSVMRQPVGKETDSQRRPVRTRAAMPREQASSLKRAQPSSPGCRWCTISTCKSCGSACKRSTTPFAAAAAVARLLAARVKGMVAARVSDERASRATCVRRRRSRRRVWGDRARMTP